jgi:hypothetical protein
MAREQVAISEAEQPAQQRLSKDMEDELYGVLGALLGMLEVLSLDATDPLLPRQRRFVDEALRFGDKLRARVEAMVVLLSDERDARHAPGDYALRRLIDHAVRGASWGASERGVALELPAPGAAWDEERLFIDPPRVDRALRGLTDALVAGVGERGRVELHVQVAGAQLGLELRGLPGERAQAEPLQVSALLLSAWQRVFALQGGSLTVDRDTFTARVQLPRRESK